MFSLREDVKKTLELIRSGEFNLAKATLNQPTSATTGLQAYNLIAPAKTLVPKNTPLRNMLPRVGGGFAIQANWKAVTAIDGATTSATPIGVPEGTRNQAITLTTTEYNAVFKTLSVEASATFQAQWAGKNFEDIVSRARRSGLFKAFVGEERILLGGNTTNTGIALGTPTAPTGVGSTTGGLMSARTVKGVVVALTLDGYKASTVSAAGIATQTTITPADGSATYTVNRGSSQKSAESANVVLSTGTSSIVWTWPDVRGAVAYGLYTGLTTATRLAAITTANKYTQVADESGATQTAASITADNSQDAYAFDGLFTQIAKSTSNAYYKTLDGASLTSTGKGGIVEFDNLLLDRWNNYQVTDFQIIVSGNRMNDVTQKIMTGTTATPFTLFAEAGQTAGIVGGARVIAYNHPLTGQQLPFIVHPDLPDGTIIFKAVDLGIAYDDDRIPNIWQVLTRQDYMSIEWPLRTFRYEIAVAFDEVLQGYAPFANGVIVNIV